MKKSLLLLCFCGTVSFLFAKKSTYFSPEENTPRIVLRADTNVVLIGSQLCVKVLAFGFQEVDSLQMSVLYDANLRFDSLRQSTTVAGEAKQTSSAYPLVISWKKAQAAGVLPDSSVLFEICIKSYTTGETGISAYDYPTAVKVFDQSGQATEIPYNRADWLCQLYVFPVEAIALAITDTVVAPGAPICLRVEVVSFEKLLVGMQFGIKWDPALLQFDSIRAGDIADLSQSQNFGLTRTAEGRLRFVWTDYTLAGIQLNAKDRLFEICFHALDTVGATAVFFSQEVLPFEFFDIVPTFYNIAADNSVVHISEDPMVLPGDTNLDGVVDHFDLLNIGIGYGALGPNRQSAREDWETQPAADWEQQLPLSQINYKHLDANGNGIIELHDADAIEVNWGFEEEAEGKAPDQIEIRSDGAPLYIDTKPILPNSQAVTLDIILGEENDQAENVYGLAFSIYYSELLTTAGNSSISATFDTSWLGNVGTDLLVLQRNNLDENRIDIALVRIDQQNRSGFGTIGHLHFTAPAFAGETPPGTDTVAILPFRIEKVRAIDAAEMEQPTAPIETISVIDISTGINNPAIVNKIHVFPNPAKNLLQIRTDDLTVENVTFYSINGKIALQYANLTTLPIESLEAGFYLCKIQTDKGLVTKRIAIVK